MPIAAVPIYLGTDFQHASPGMRFGMYLKLWGVNRRSQSVLWGTHDVGYEVRGQNHQEREVKYENKVSALTEAKRLNDNDQETMKALLRRQKQAFDAIATPDGTLRLDALAVAPFTTGLGNEHPLENGFSFLTPYGLPYLPGSGVKGVLRQAARELAGGEWGDSCGWSEEKRYALSSSNEEDAVMLSMLDVLFGRESASGDTDHLRGTLVFWDVIPQIVGNSLTMEIMTPHQGHYYQGDSAMGSNSPHESGKPNPISFLTVPPKSGFVFHVQCDLARLQRLAPDLAANRWQNLISVAFTHAFDWLGFGAKTAVGYGQMRWKNGDAPESSVNEPKNKASTPMAGSSVSSSPVQFVWENAALAWNPGSQTLSAICDAKKKAEAQIGADRTMVSEEIIGRIRKKKQVRANVTVEPVGGKFFRIVKVEN